MIKITISVSVLDASTIVFDAKDQNFVKLSEFEHDSYFNSSNIAITINNLCKICIAAIIVGFFAFIIFFATQATNESIVSIEFDTISIVICAIQNLHCHKLYINSNTSSKLNENRIVEHTTNKSITIVFMIVKYCTLATKTHKMDQLCPIIDKTHTDIFISIMNVTDTIAHQIEILLVIYVIIHESSLFIITHGTFMVIYAFSAHSNTTALFSFCLKINNIDNLNLIVCIIITIIVQIAGACIFLTIVAIPNGILIVNRIQKEILVVNSMKVE